MSNALSSIGHMDELARYDSPIHRLDPRAKLITCLVFVVAVVSHDKYSVSALLPFTVFPLFLLLRSGLPARHLWTRLAIAAPFALMVGIFNPLLDQQTLLTYGNWEISGGWVSFTSIGLRFLLTIGTLIMLVATTGMPSLCRAALRLKTPQVFVTQILLLYRYLFLLLEEGQRLQRARSLRNFGGKGSGLRPTAQLLGQLFLRAHHRAQRIYQSMRCRGFDGELRLLQTLKMQSHDWSFMLAWLLCFALLRFSDPAMLLGQTLTGILS